MRFLRLELAAFGHFQGEVLDFSNKQPGFHLVYGSNEAGKSTALRAIRGFLYGIPQQSRDTFLHSGNDLRLGAELLTDDGSRFYAVRRKGRKNTLLDAEGVPMDEQRLEALCAEPNLFDAMFGLDHETLRHGAEELLDGKAGESVFGAGMGVGSVRRLYNELSQGADALFTSRSRKMPINLLIDELRAARQAVDLQATSAESYTAKERALSELRQEWDKKTAERARLRSEKSALERKLRVLPLLARRAQNLEQLSQLGALPELSPDAEQRRVAAERQVSEAKQRGEHEALEIERVERRLGELSASPELAELEARVIDDLASRLGQHRKAQLDLPKRQAELRALHDEMRRALTELGSDLAPERAEELLLTAIEEQKLQRLCREKTRFDTQLSDTSGKLKKVQGALLHKKKELARVPLASEPSALSAALARAQRTTGAEQRLHASTRRLQRLEERLGQAMAGLPGYSGTLPELHGLSVPSTEVVLAFETEWSKALRLRDELRLETEALELGRIELCREEQILGGQGEVPTREHLLSLRARRDHAVQGLADVSGKGASPSSEELATVRQLVAQCDEYADRLFNEADRVSQRARIAAALKENEDKRSLLQKRSQEREAEWQALEQAWHAEWESCRVEPARPRDMIEWLRRRDETIALVEERDTVRDECRGLERQLATAHGDLSMALEAVGEPPRQLWETNLISLCDRAASVVERLTRQRAERADMERTFQLEERQLEELAHEQEELKARVKHWRGDWYKALDSLGMPRDSGPEEVLAAVGRLSDLGRLLGEVRHLRRRIAGMERDSKQLEADVHSLLDGAVPEDQWRELSLEQACDTLIRRARRARADAEEAARLRQDAEQRRGRVSEALLSEQRAEQELQELMARANVADLRQLVAVEERVAKASRLSALVAELDDEIVGQGDGASLSTLIEQADGALAEEVRERIDAIELALSACEQRVDELSAQVATEEQQLGRLARGAAQESEELAAKTAELQQTVRRYVELRLGALLLQREVESYRDEHQGPVLRRAGEIFPELTLGAYRGLRVGFDKKDEQILLCVRNDGREVIVEGLSDGTRDQLYLALRLASLERYLERKPSMPLVLDDVLVHFDDDRARAALSVLGKVSERMQVLFFSHHERIVQLAKETIDDHVLDVHQLRGGPAVRVA